MPLSTDTLDEPQLNLTPMIDIVFLLIIFFMVGTRFSERENQYDVQLPTATAVAPMTAAPDAIVINVARNGDITVNGDELSLAELRQLLQEAVANYPKQSAMIRGDGEGAYQNVINAMDACYRVKIAPRLSFQPVSDDAGDTE